jgi:ribosomal protein S17E
MELWQASISICAGIITIVTLLEKFGITHRFKKLDTDFNEFRKLIAQVADIQKKQQEFE